jgi:hypothetical protein
MPVTVTTRLIELEPSAGSYDGSRIELAAGGGYVEVNQTYSEITIADGVTLTTADPTSAFKKRLMYFIYGDPTPGAYVVGKEVR